MLLQNGQVDAAYQVAEKLLKDAPNDIGANLVLATVFFSRGLYDRAREHAQEALDSPVDDLRQPSARKLLARTYVHQGDYEKAAQQYAQLVQDLPELQDGYLQLAMCQEADRQTDKALETLTQARNQFPDSSGPVAAMGLFLLRQNKQDEAIKTFREAITKTPPDPISFNNLATLLADRDQTEEAVGYARTAARLFPRHWGILDTLGWIHCRQGDVKEGLPYLNQALALAPENREIQYHLGYALAKLKRFDAARWHLRIALSGTGPFTGTEAAAKLLASLPGE
jgi:tetratricopeptide (TPR) repeat protein